MNPLPELINGLRLLEPFLTRHGFTLDTYENGQGSGGQFTRATYKKADRKFVISYRYSIGELYYQFEDLAVGHDFYLKQLGHGDKMKFPDFQSEDRLETFRNVLHDFDLIRSDFFEGDCKELKRIEELQKKHIDNLQRQSQINGHDEGDLRKIQKAREKFKTKDYKESLDIYRTIDNKNVLSDFDLRTMYFCKQRVG
jgi:hypothetical protein